MHLIASLKVIDCLEKRLLKPRRSPRIASDSALAVNSGSEANRAEETDTLQESYFNDSANETVISGIAGIAKARQKTGAPKEIIF